MPQCDEHHWKIRDVGRFLVAVMTELAGDAHISLEGDLAATKVLGFEGASANETPILKRNTSWPVQDFVVLPLEPIHIKEIIAGIGGTVSRRILHVQIEKSGRLELGLYDNFNPFASFFGPRLTTEFFAHLEEEGVLKKIG